MWMSPANHVPSTGGQGLARSSRKGDALAEQGGIYMSLSNDSRQLEITKLLKAFLDKNISQSTFERACEIMKPIKGMQEKEAQAKKLCEIITSSKTEEEILERMDALE